MPLKPSRSTADGLSPRGRGNRNDDYMDALDEDAVYPRVGGGTCLVSRIVASRYIGGLSPRGRGNRMHERSTSTLGPGGLSPRGRGNHRRLAPTGPLRQ